MYLCYVQMSLLAKIKTTVYRKYSMNDNPKNNILMFENIRQKRLTILEQYDAYICHHHQPKMIK